MYRFAVNLASGARISRNGSHQIEFGVEVVEELADAARVAMGPKQMGGRVIGELIANAMEKAGKEGVITIAFCFDKVGTISANGGRVIGKLIANAMEKAGKEGGITIAKYVAAKLLNYLDLALCQSIAGWETLYNEFEGKEAVTLSWKKDRVTDGRDCGGVALLYASKELEKLQIMNINQKIGVQIIQNVLKAPVHKTVSNTGIEGTVVVGKLLEQDDPHLGYDAAKDIELPKDEKEAPAMGAGGMGGMDY
ncbi:Chaperonin CPN60-1 like [Actinidia chinensis var. chinensis]|uniref:Chaperonin CPN60-1 like n=1 Tax=Actinidia chinensis var. chinensis TaxID=1590841 RepID=A0A2R6PPH5_ACTCC|nr:Chaperonin CPN60-1 like [Actinidia chinensis var. chinensis]